MSKNTRRHALLSLASLLAVSLSLPANADKKFSESDDAKQAENPQEYLKNYDKLVKGKEADWVWFDGYSASAFKSVTIKEFTTNNKHSRSKMAAEVGKDFFTTWIKRSKKLGWEVKDGGDLTIESNICNSWEPTGGARMWGGWMANPGVCEELIGKDKSGKTVFEIRHKAKGSTIEDAVENGVKKIVEDLEAGK